MAIRSSGSLRRLDLDSQPHAWVDAAEHLEAARLLEFDADILAGSCRPGAGCLEGMIGAGDADDRTTAEIVAGQADVIERAVRQALNGVAVRAAGPAGEQTEALDLGSAERAQLAIDPAVEAGARGHDRALEAGHGRGDGLGRDAAL